MAISHERPRWRRPPVTMTTYFLLPAYQYLFVVVLDAHSFVCSLSIKSLGTHRQASIRCLIASLGKVH